MHACGICTDEQVEFIRQVGFGNVDALRVYLESGGDPEFECHNILNGRIFLGNTESLIWAVVDGAYATEGTSPMEMATLYLRYNKTQQAKDIFLKSFMNAVAEGYESVTPDMVKVMVKSKGRFFQDEEIVCLLQYWETWIPRFLILYEAEYDFNQQNDNGETLLMQHVDCITESEEEADGQMKILKFLLAKVLERISRTMRERPLRTLLWTQR